jgi:hypothetical protein
MKKLTYLLGLGAVASLFFLNSCDTGGDAVGPSLTVTSGESVTVPANSIIVIDWRADAGDAKLASFTIKEGNNAIVDENIRDWNQLDIPNAMNETYIDSAIVRVGANDTQFTLVVTDKDDLIATKTVTVTIDQTATGNPINTFSARLMGAQSNLDIGSYLDVVSGTVHKQAAAESNSAAIDIVYYYGSQNAATLTAPDDATVNGGAGNLSLCVNFTQKNPTRFSSTTMTSAEFDAVSDDLPIAGLSASATKMTQLAVNNVIAFETFDGKKGIIKVSALDTGSDGTITIDVKVQE